MMKEQHILEQRKEEYEYDNSGGSATVAASEAPIPACQPQARGPQHFHQQHKPIRKRAYRPIFPSKLLKSQ